MREFINVVQSPDFLYGLVGFIGYEGLRIFRSSVNRQRPRAIPRDDLVSYFIGIVLVACFSGIVAHVFAAGDAGRSLFVGFSVPSGLKAAVGSMSQAGNVSSGLSEDITTSRVGILRRLQINFRSYFSD